MAAVQLSEIVLGEADAKAAMLALEDNVQGMMDNADIPLEVQMVIGSKPIRTISLFSHMGTDEASFKTFVKEHLKIDATKGFEQCMCVGNLTILWGATRDRVKKASDTKATASATGLPRHIPNQDYMSLVSRWAGSDDEEEEDRTVDKRTPGKTCVDSTIEDIEEGALEGWPITDMASKSEDKKESWVQADWTPEG